MNDPRLPVALLCAALAWGVWYLRHAYVTGEAPGPPYGVYREASPALYWFLMISFAAILIGVAIAAVLLLLGRF